MTRRRGKLYSVLGRLDTLPVSSGGGSNVVVAFPLCVVNVPSPENQNGLSWALDGGDDWKNLCIYIINFTSRKIIQENKKGCISGKKNSSIGG